MCSAFVVQKRQFNELSFISGAKEDRTPDPLLAKQVLSQLSYNPKCSISIALFKSVEKKFLHFYFQTSDQP